MTYLASFDWEDDQHDSTVQLDRVCHSVEQVLPVVQEYETHVYVEWREQERLPGFHSNRLSFKHSSRCWYSSYVKDVSTGYT